VVPKRNSFDAIVELLKKNKGESAIIYCFSRKETESIAGKLKKAKIKALPYHA
jgi:ATP-dependent DNA helicase RecQ